MNLRTDKIMERGVKMIDKEIRHLVKANNFYQKDYFAQFNQNFLRFYCNYPGKFRDLLLTYDSKIIS